MSKHNGLELKTSMEHLARLFEEFAAEEKRLQNCLMEKDWPGMEDVLSAMNRLSEEIGAGEKKRAECFERVKAESGLPDEVSFYEIIASIPEPLRIECTLAYRNMRCAVLLVKSYSGDISSYVMSATSSLREILEELYPHRRGKLYTKNGAARASRGDALVLNRHL